MTDESFTTTDGATMSFTRYPAPRPGAPRVAFIHSLALDRGIWDEVVERIRPHAEVLTYDCRGHGRSDRRMVHRADRKVGPYSAELFADDLAALFDRAGWQHATIAGCSMGGSVALALAARHARRASGLLLIDTTAWYGEQAASQFKERAVAARTKGMTGLIDFQLTRWFSDEFRASHPETLTRLTEVFVAADLDCYAASCDLLGAVDERSHLESIRVPTRVAVGEDDQATPVVMARYLHEHIPASTLTIIPGARHLTPIEHPDTIASELLTLIQRG